MKLSIAYTDYLQNATDMTIRNLVYELRQNNLHEQANCLDIWHKNDYSTSLYTWSTGIWSGTTCHIGLSPMPDPVPGDLWLDVKQLTPKVLVPDSRGNPDVPALWIAIQPIFRWQYRAFLNLVKYRIATRYFLEADDLLHHRKNIVEVDETLLLSDIYFEESAVYAGWFRYRIASDSDLVAARNYLSDDQFNSIFPDTDMKFWMFEDFLPSEFYRVARNRSTLDVTGKEQVEELSSQQNLPHTVYDEWHRASNIGCLIATSDSYVYRKPTRPSKGPVWEFVELLNNCYHLKNHKEGEA